MASVPYTFECSKDSGFVMDPNEAKRVGYVLELDGFGLTDAGGMKKDLWVPLPYNPKNASDPFKYKGVKPEDDPGKGPNKILKVVGVMENFEWNGGVGDPIKITYYVSQGNAHKVKALQQSTLKTTVVKTLKWWIADFDQETKVWFEQSFPNTSDEKISGLITGKENPELDVDLTPVVAKDGIDVNVYKITMSVAPGANNSFVLHMANSAGSPVAKGWGIKIGDLAEAAYK